MRISDWSSDVCSSDLFDYPDQGVLYVPKALPLPSDRYFNEKFVDVLMPLIRSSSGGVLVLCTTLRAVDRIAELFEERFEDEAIDRRSEEHTSELQSLMRNSYAVFCLKKKKYNTKLI